jgi:hypothetical protein
MSGELLDTLMGAVFRGLALGVRSVAAPLRSGMGEWSTADAISADWTLYESVPHVTAS